MEKNDHNTFVLSLGGSLVVPNGGIDTQYLKRFNEFIRNQISSNKRRFFVVVGGGGTTRHYQDAARAVVGDSVISEDLDWIGIHTTRINAHLLRTIFRDIAHPKVIEHYDEKTQVSEPLAIASGWKPGWSTDYDAVRLCELYGGKLAVNLTNVDQVYDKDPKKFPDAKPLIASTWVEYRAMVGDTWTPGLNVPFDPIAAKLAQEIGCTVKILNGKNLDNLMKALDGQKFVGTTIA